LLENVIPKKMVLMTPTEGIFYGWYYDQQEIVVKGGDLWWGENIVKTYERDCPFLNAHPNS
jgi:hypothetical protein